MCNDEFGADEPHEYEQTEACGTSPCPNLSNDNDGVGAGCLSDMHYLSPSIKCFEHSEGERSTAQAAQSFENALGLIPHGIACFTSGGRQCDRQDSNM